jgi:hypothetical protein
MKNLLLLILTVFTLTSCDKDDDKPKTELEKLPPATQTGARTFGCLLDAVAFVSGNQNISKYFVYQYVNGYYFSLQGNRYVNKELILLGLSTDNLKIEEGKTYILQDKIDGNASAKYFDDYDDSRTTSIEKGEMTITKLYFNKHIVSGTFFYDIKDSKGVVHKITNGRFDMPFTQ